MNRCCANTNVSCIPKLGVFQLHKARNNFTNAELICNDEGGLLADITTRYHTEQLASLIATERIKEAFVGLSRLEYPGEFLNSLGYPLNCLNYRAWAPGEPKPKENAKCVTLTSKMQWKITSCSRELPFLCELSPNGPYRPCQKFYTLKRKQRCLEILKASLPRTNRFPKCGDPDYFEMVDKRRSNRKRNRNRQHY
uniref:C-type lectin domain-containing protein n=1 Tax=Rhodnius prolixus TaxID=13249 RepID=T1HFU0_RHOPR